MEKDRKLGRLQECLKEVNTWRANDGGLTIAASDIISLIHKAIHDIKNDCVVPQYWVGDCDTGLEQDVCDIVLG